MQLVDGPWVEVNGKGKIALITEETRKIIILVWKYSIHRQILKNLTLPRGAIGTEINNSHLR